MVYHFMNEFYQCYEARLDEHVHDEYLMCSEQRELSILECFPIIMRGFDPNIDDHDWVNSVFDVTDDSGITLLMEVASAGNLHFTRFLVNLGADVNTIGYHGDFALSFAAKSGWRDLFDYLYPLTHEDLQEEAKQDWNDSRFTEYRQKRDQRYLECLIQAVKDNNFTQLKALILLRADVNAVSEQGETALHEACRLGHLDLIIKLLESGADINREVNGETPLSVARQANQPEVVQLLIANGAKSLI